MSATNDNSKPQFPPADATYSEVQRWYRIHGPPPDAAVISIQSAKIKRGVYWRQSRTFADGRHVEGPIWEVRDTMVRIHDGTPNGYLADLAGFEDHFAPVPLSELRAWYNGSQTVIAFSPLDASRVYAEHIGEAHDDVRHPWRLVTASIAMTDENGRHVECTPEEFIEAHGRGFLCSEDR